MKISSLRLIILATVLVACVGCDQATKRMATVHLQGEPARSFWNDTLRLQYALNSGGFLSVGSSLSWEARRWIFLGLNGVALAMLTGFLLARPALAFSNFFAGSLILAGGIGNLIDRYVNQGLVVDFLNIGLGAVRSGIFNVADVAISAGLIVWLINVSRNDGSEATPRPAETRSTTTSDA